uniref:Protein kinase domain-containing protein n=1 Tax=Quercus lobata TaxID=97700 RepID=A0A7N2RCQ9_QUELO
MLLVYQYISNGNLYDWLHPGEDKIKILDWPSRIKISVGIARGLACLHRNCHFSVVHLSLSLNAILLDQNFEAKISNFGEAIILKPGGLMFVNSSDNDMSIRVFDGSGVRELDYFKKDVYDFENPQIIYVARTRQNWPSTDAGISKTRLENEEDIQPLLLCSLSSPSCKAIPP